MDQPSFETPTLETDTAPHKSFLASFVGVSVALSVLIYVSGWIIDPFRHFEAKFSHYPWGTEDRHYASYTLNRSLFKLVQFELYVDNTQPAPKSVNVLVGDSLANQIDPEILSELTGEAWFSLAYGGASLKESVELVRHLIDRPEVKSIAWGLPFMRVRLSAKNELPRSLRMAERPWQHLFTVEHLRAIYYELRYRWSGAEFNDPKRFRTVQERVDYGIYRMRIDMGQLEFPAFMLDWANDVLAEAEAKAVPVELVEWPVHPQLREMIASEMPDHYQLYSDFMDRYCARRILTIGPEGSEAPLYVDALHLDLPHKRRLSEALVDRLSEEPECGVQPPQP